MPSPLPGPRRIRGLVTPLVALLAALLTTSPPAARGADPPLFEDRLAEVLRQRCGKCHGAETQKGAFALHTPEALRKGAESGPVLSPGDPADSRLYEVVETGVMPPPGETPLTAVERQLLHDWLEGGARFREAPPAPQITAHQALPILWLRCTVCHGGRKREADLDLRTRDSLLRGGRSGPAIVPGDPATSRLLLRLHAGEMPPKEQLTLAMVKPVEPDELETLTRWIAAGAPAAPPSDDRAGQLDDPLVRPADREFWAFRPPHRPPLPRPGAAAVPHNPIDLFLLERLEPVGLGFNPPAHPDQLLRRASFALTGLPPSPAQQQDFAAELPPGATTVSEEAWARLIDRLLASPQYGERWGRIWLDLAGYADCEGRREQHLPRPFAWKYRDYVVRSLNADKPYDQFLIEQLAGDDLVDYRGAAEITPEIEDLLVATGFLRMAPDPTWANLTGFVPDRLEVIADSLDVLAGGVLGLTLKCARCHSHKFDPLPQRDYYRLAAVFKGAWDEHNWLKPETAGFGGALNAGLAERLLPHVRTSERRLWESTVADLYRQVALVQQQEPGPQRDEQLRQLQAKRPREPRLFALWDSGDPSPTWIYRRGDYRHPGLPVEPGVPAVLHEPGQPLPIPPPPLNTTSTGRRLAFARWLTQPRHPLTSRVLVNRVWHHHFGQGLVRTLGNFGTKGDRPSHPELLDWLSCEFVDRGWSLKELHRLILTSAAWRQSSQVTDRAATHDPDRRLVSRQALRRLDAEQLGDTLRLAAGQLDLRPGGPADPVQIHPEGLVTAGPRRGLYNQQLRKFPVTLLESFDLPQLNPNCLARHESLVAPQALHLLNDSGVREWARQAAEQSAGRDPAETTSQLMRRLVGRPPTPAEQTLLLSHLAELTAAWQQEPGLSVELAEQRARQTLAHALLNSALFLYID
ncbi:MAG: PSD1 and planctomycete cytochrome C domain-containing protein [Planctomycetaceae bacterium]